MSETYERPMRWANYVMKCKSLNYGNISCLEFAVALASFNLSRFSLNCCKYSTIFRCGWKSKDGKKSVYHILPIIRVPKLWNIVNYIPEVNDLTTLDIQDYNYEESDDGLCDAAKKFYDYFLPKMIEYYGMHKRNDLPMIQIVKCHQFEEFIHEFEGKKMSQTEVLKELFG